MRAYLIVGAARKVDLDAALSCGADALVVDLGDWTNDAERQDARAVARRLLIDAGKVKERPALYVRIAPLDSDAIDDDLEALVPAAPDGVFLSNACGGASLQRLSAKLAVREAECGREDGATGIVAMATQTPAAIFELGSYAGATRRLEALAFDFDSASLPGRAQPPGGPTAPFALARALTAFGAAAARVAAIDRPFPDPADAHGLREECRFALRDGFSAKLAAYPTQIRLIKETFAGGDAKL